MNTKAPKRYHDETLINGIKLANLDYSGASDQIIAWAENNENRYVCACNVHSTTTARWDLSLRRALKESDINTADGTPLVWMQRLLGYPEAQRTYGPTLMLKVLEKAQQENLRIAFYGGHPDRMPLLQKNLLLKFPHLNIVKTIVPPFSPLTKEEDEHYTKELNASKAQIIFVGIGCPKQEIWMHRHSHRISGVMIGVGAAFDFHAGAVEQAPEWMQKAGLEWAFRLSREPKRLFKRYLTTNPIFILSSAQQLIQAKLEKKNFQSTSELFQQQTYNNLKDGAHIAICIATYQRPIQLAILLESIIRSHLPKNYSIELRVIDNDASSSSKYVVDEFCSKNPILTVNYDVESKQNIARARNKAIEMGDADAYVFVDDDEIVEFDWLNSLIHGMHNNRSDASFGPVKCILGKAAKKWQGRGKFFEKAIANTDSTIDWCNTRTSNTIVRGEWFNQRHFRFDPELGRSGGSDSDLFARMQEFGAHFSTSHEAFVKEYVPKERASLKWLWKRAYRNGLIYERNRRQIKNPNYPYLRAFKRIILTTLWIVKSIPALTIGKPEAFYRAILKIALTLGGLHATIVPSSTIKHVAYRKNSMAKENKNKRVAFLTNIVSPYRKPVFQKLNQSDAFDLKIFADAKTEFDRKWKVDYDELPIEQTDCFSWKQKEYTDGATRYEQTLTKHMPYGLLYQLYRYKPDTVISLELGLRTAFAALYCKLTKSELIIWSYQSRVSAQQSYVRKFWRKTLLKQASKVVGMGKQAHEVLLKWGVNEDNIIDAPNAADQAHYLLRLSEGKCGRQVETLREVYAPDKKLAIVVGRLVPLKGIEIMIQTWNALPETTKSQWKLLFIGSGPLEELIKVQNSAEIELAGNVPVESMPFWYSAADLHIFPTCGDVWGLVVNEASICGTPTLCSEHAGCYDDLIRDGENGFKFDVSNLALAREKLEMVLQRNDLDEIGQVARETIQSYTPDSMASRFAYAIGNH